MNLLERLDEISRAWTLVRILDLEELLNPPSLYGEFKEMLQERVKQILSDEKAKCHINV